ncbi:MAG: hypothetical protein HC902_00915 [Calothrix sp. SM1_5_4]|nr:hypothetical protein [Calothrix sp. SM1_5_4]
MTAFVVNEAGGGKFAVEERRCGVRRHGMIFPYEIEESPNLLYAFDCELRLGNSGGPMFAPSDDAVQAVVQGVLNVEETARRAGRALREDEKRPMVLATNLRCVDLPGVTPVKCTAVTAEESGRRVRRAREQALREVHAQKLATAAGDVSYRAVTYSLSSGEYEVYYHPVCRRVPRLSRIHLPHERVKLNIDAWGALQAESLETRLSRATVITDGEGGRTGLRVEWADRFGSFEKADEDPRVSLGDSFSIDLPRCAR